MKIIRIIETGPQLKLDFHPDSTLILQGRPLFMPEFGGNAWQAEIYIAVRIGRLGKNISQKFASRYYDGLTAAMRLTLPSEPEMEPVVAGMDSSIAHGTWLDPALAAEPLRITAAEASASLPAQAPLIDEAISRVSEYTTLKMGDIILLPAADLMLPVAAPSHLNLMVGDETVLSQKLV